MVRGYDWKCDVCGHEESTSEDRADGVDLDGEEDESLAALPDGWTHIVASRVGPTEGYEQFLAGRRQLERMPDVDDVSRATMLQAYTDAAGNPEPRTLVKLDVVVCPDHADLLDELGLGGEE